MDRRWTYALLVLLLAACGTPTADSADAIATWRTTVEAQVRHLDPTTDDMGVNMRRYYYDATAREQTHAAMDEVQQIHARLVQLTPPPSRQALHDLVLDATKDCANAMDAYRAAFANNNANEDAPKGYALLQRCRAKLQQLQKKDFSL